MLKRFSEINTKQYYNDICNKILEVDNFMIMTGGIGDLIAMDYFKAFPQEFSLIFDLSIKPYIKKEIYNTVFPEKQIISFWHTHPNNPVYLQNKIVKFCNLNGKNFYNYYLQHFIKNQINTNQINKNSIFNKQLTTLKFCLPKQYITIHPTSINVKNYKNRNFTSKDWNKTIENLEFNKIHGIVLGLNQKIPQHSLLINLTDMTNILESIEIVKNSKGFIGISSAFSVLAARFVNPNNILIKNNSSWCLTNLNFYYPTHKKHQFIQKSINKIINLIKFI